MYTWHGKRINPRKKHPYQIFMEIYDLGIWMVLIDLRLTFQKIKKFHYHCSFSMYLEMFRETKRYNSLGEIIIKIFANLK